MGGCGNWLSDSKLSDGNDSQSSKKQYKWNAYAFY